MSSLNKFRTAAVAATAFYTPKSSSSLSTPATRLPKKQKKGRSLTKMVRLEMMSNLSTDYTSPYQLASEGNIDELKKFIEVYGLTIKERDEHEATLLHHAASTNQTSVMEYLITSGIEMSAKDKNGHTALHVAVYQGYLEATKLLLANNADVTILNNAMDPPLHIAIRSGHIGIVQEFLEQPNIDLTLTGYRKRNTLHIIAECDNEEVADLVHNTVLTNENFKNKRNFRLCASDEDDLTPIHLAARKGSYRVLNKFMSGCKAHGYPPEVVLGFIDEENSTPLHAAIDSGFIKVVEVLLKHGADPMVQKDSQVPPFLVACSQGKIEMMDIMLKSSNMELIFCVDMYGQTCLHRTAHAINSNHSISYLVDKGANVNALDNKGQTPLMVSIIAGSSLGTTTLIERGADVLIKDNEGNNALHHAIKSNREKIVDILLELPCASKIVVDLNNKESSPIHNALTFGHNSLVNPMIKVIRGKMKNIKDKNGSNYLHLASGSGNWKALNCLLEIPECLSLLNETGACGGTPLHAAAYNGHRRCAEILLSYGAMIHKCYRGLTPFMCACSRGHSEVARILYKAHPFQLAWSDDEGRNSLHIGAQGGDPAVITLLLDIGVPITHDFFQESFLDIIIEKNHTKCAIAVVDHDRYQECLDLISPIHPHPMISLIVQMPDIAKRVLDRMHTTSDVARTSSDYWENFDFKYLRLKSSPGHEVKEEEEEVDASDHSEKMMMENPIIKYKGSLSSRAMLTKSEPYKDPCPRIAHLRSLQIMVKHNRSGLLTHPVSNAYLKSKWRIYGRWLHLAQLSCIFLQVLFLLLFTSLVPRPSSIISSLGQMNNSIPCGSAMNGTSECLRFSYFANICRFVTLSFVAVNFIIWLLLIIQIRQEALNVIGSSYVLIDLLSVAFTLWYLLPTQGIHNANWLAGAVAAFFNWFSLVLKIQLFEVFGVYITMFLAITRRVFQVLIICFLFIIAFGLSLYILAGNLTEYSTIGYSLFTNFGHLLGEIDYVRFVNADLEGDLPYSWLTYLFVTALAIIMGIVIMNMLIGLAVGDIDAIRCNAIAEKKFIEVSFFSQCDVIIPPKLLWRLDKAFVSTFPNKHKFILRRVWHFFWSSVRGENPDLNNNGDPSLDNSQKNQEITKMKEKIEEMRINQERMMLTLSKMNELQDTLIKLFAASNKESEESVED